MEDVSANTSAIANEIERIFSLQQRNSQHIGLTSYQERIEKLKKLQDLILQSREHIKDAVYRDFKKAPEEVDLTEIYTVVSEIRYTIKHLRSWMKPRRISNTIATLGARSKVIFQSKGVCLILSPWNYPFQLSLGPLISAIAAGNCVMMKPSEFSPHTSGLVKTLLHGVFNEDEVRVFEGDHTVAQLLLKLPFNHIYFTGSPQVGKIIMAEASNHLASVTLELGGKSPVIIDQNADLDVAARRIIWGKLINAGQTCIAPDYVLIPKTQKEAFLNKAIQAVRELYGPLEGMIDNPDYCRIISSRHFQRIKELLEESVHQSAEVVFGGVTREEDNYISPTIIGSVPLDSPIMQEEIFGPLLPVITYEKEQEILDIIYARPRPLVLYIFSPRDSFIQRMIENTHSGDVLINDVVTHYANVKLPFGGVNNSGIGKAHGMYGFKQFSHLRSVMRQGKYTLTSMFYPPYSQRINKLINLVLKHG